MTEKFLEFCDTCGEALSLEETEAFVMHEGKFYCSICIPEDTKEVLEAVRELVRQSPQKKETLH